MTSERTTAKTYAQDTAHHQPRTKVDESNKTAGVAPVELQMAVAEPAAARPSALLTLQRHYGNRATQRLIQTKLQVGPAGDHYEQEADRVADQVMTMPAQPAVSGQPAVQRQAQEEEEVQTKPLAGAISPLLQRQAEDEEEVQTKPLAGAISPLLQRQAEEEVQTKPLAGAISPLLQRQAEDEEEIQTKRQDPGAGFEAGSTVENQLRAQRGNGSHLPAEVRNYMEPRFGADFSGVRVHADGQAAQLNRQLSAQAFTHGQDIYLGEGQYQPGSNTGQRLLAHELTHVVQQTGGVQRQPEAPVPTLQPVSSDATAAPRVQRVFTGVNMASQTAVEAYLERRFTQLKGGWTSKSTRKTKATKILSHSPGQYRDLVRERYRTKFSEDIVEPAKFEADTVTPHSPAGSGFWAAAGKTTAAGIAGIAALPLLALGGIGYGIYKGVKSIKTTWTMEDLRKKGFSAMSIMAIETLGLGFGPNEAKRAAKKLYAQNSPASLLTAAQIEAIAALSRTVAGPAWMATAGFTSPDEADRYARGGDFRDWENKPAGLKMQVANIQWHLGDAGLVDFQNTPGYWKGQSCHGKTGAIQARDTQAWAKTLVAPSKEALTGKLTEGEKTTVAQDKNFGSMEALQARSAAAVQIMKRLFVILQKGLSYSPAKEAEFRAWEAPVAVALSHGGRVNIRIPKAAQAGHEHDLFNWLMGGQGGMKMANVYERTAGTHRVAIGEDTKTKKGSFKEKKGFGAAINAMLGTETGDTFHYGLDVPVGGTGERDLNGDVILPNGAYGHLYIGYKPPTTKRDGALLIGCETDAPGKTNALGHKHTAKATSAEFSTTGGAKKDKIGMEKGGMLVDLNQVDPVGNDWLGKLKQMEDDVEHNRISVAQLVGQRLDQIALE
jgi:hypothetical protein